MLYNKNKTLSHLNAAGKITVVTTLLGVLVFVFIFLLNIGSNELNRVEAQSNATTSVTVLNTPPQWTLNAYETIESSTSTPTNSGDTITWAAIGTDSNSEDYQLLICSTSTAPTPGTSTTSPTCATGATNWAVSATTTSGSLASAATTTTEASPFSEVELWWGWICDSIDLNARCNTTPQNGYAATNTSPFNVNSRPLFTSFWDTSAADPGDAVVFTSTSSDPDSVGGTDTVQLVVCATSSYDGTLNACQGTTLATSSLVTTNATGTYTVVIPTQDAIYGAYGYILDEHGHEAIGATQASDSVLEVNNVAPTVAGGTIIVNVGNPLILATEGGETAGQLLQFTVTDDNSCRKSGGGEEITDYALSLYRSTVGSTTCDAITGTYNANNCYTSEIGFATWGLTCTATTTTNDCNFDNDGTDRTRIFSCDFPLWYVADPTDGTSTSTQYSTSTWMAEVRAIDDNFATGTSNESASGQNLNSLLAFTLDTLAIPYGELEPNTDTGTLSATTTMSATGNVGMDQKLSGEHMCGTYSGATPCATSASSTIPDSSQEFGISALSYGAGTSLSSTTQQELEINIQKSTSTTTPASEITYWGIGVPAAITVAGIYTGENTFIAVSGEATDW